MFGHMYGFQKGCHTKTSGSYRIFEAYMRVIAEREGTNILNIFINFYKSHQTNVTKINTLYWQKM